MKKLIIVFLILAMVIPKLLNVQVTVNNTIYTGNNGK